MGHGSSIRLAHEREGIRDAWTWSSSLSTFFILLKYFRLADRKKYMQALGRAQDLDMTFVEAVRKDSDEMKWIMEQKYQDYVAKISRPDGFGPDGKMDWYVRRCLVLIWSHASARHSLLGRTDVPTGG